MNFAETLKLAFAAIWAHKLRSFLTLLGMIIVVAAFMTVLSHSIQRRAWKLWLYLKSSTLPEIQLLSSRTNTTLPSAHLSFLHI